MDVNYNLKKKKKMGGANYTGFHTKLYSEYTLDSIEINY